MKSVDLYSNAANGNYLRSVAVFCLAAMLIAPARGQTVSYSASTLATVGGNGPNGVTVDSSGNVYVTVGNAVERIVSGGVSLIAGSLTNSGSADGIGSAAQFNGPAGLAADSAGNIYVADSNNNAIRKVTALGTVSTLAGLIQGNADGVGVAAQFNKPTAVAVDNAGNVYAVDAGNNELRRIAPNGATTTWLSGSSFTFANNLYGPYAASYAIAGVAVDSAGIPYVGVAVSIPFGNGLRPANVVSVLKVTGAGAYTQQFQVSDAAGSLGAALGDGALALDGNANVYVLSGDVLFKGTAMISTLVGTVQTSDIPVAIAADSTGRIYAANPPTKAVVVVVPVGIGPSITAQPSGGGVIAYGASTILSVVASGTPPPTYQWQINGTNIAGATSSTYAATLQGTYTVVVTNAAGSVTSNAVVVTAANRLVNISTRALVGTGANVAIAGFVLSGPAGSTKQLLIRAVGPGLTQFGITGFLVQPTLTVFDSSGSVIATNTGWNTNSNAAQVATVAAGTGAFALQLGSADSALLLNLPPGAYTAQVSGVSGSTGVALAEVYEVAADSTQLINISTRANVGVGATVEIGGLVISGSQPCKVLIRASGPALTQFGVPGVLGQPSLTVVASNGQTVASNTGWSSNSNAVQIAATATTVGAFPFPSGSADCAMLVTLQPGSYTAVVSGAGGSTGTALVEVYQAP